MKKAIIITGSLCIISYLFEFFQCLLSSMMQGVYKSQIDIYAENTVELLEKKQFWVEFGTREILPSYIADIFFFSFFLLSFIALILKFISLKDTERLIKKVLIILSASCVLSLIIMRIAVFFMDYVTFAFLFLACCIALLLLLFILLLKKIDNSRNLG